jgi:hypothetical protein
MMAGPADDIYFYDYGHDDIKVVATVLGAGVAEVIPGLGLGTDLATIAKNGLGNHLRPEDGVVTADGTIYLLADRWQNGFPTTQPRFAIYARRRGDSWRGLPLLDNGELGHPSRRVVYGSVHLGLSIVGDVYVYNSAGIAISVAEAKGPLKSDERRKLSSSAARLR